MSTRTRKQKTPSPAMIPQQLIPAVRMRLTMIEQKRLEVAALELELRNLLSRVCQIDLEQEAWELDDARMMLTRQDVQGS